VYIGYNYVKQSLSVTRDKKKVDLKENEISNYKMERF